MILDRQDTRLDTLHSITGRLSNVSKEISNSLDRTNVFMHFFDLFSFTSYLSFHFISSLSLIYRQIDEVSTQIMQNQEKVNLLNKSVDVVMQSRSLFIHSSLYFIMSFSTDKGTCLVIIVLVIILFILLVILLHILFG